MKKLFLLFALFLNSAIVLATIDERKIDVYFANGISTSKAVARFDAGILRDAIIDKYRIVAYNKMIGNVGYSYNETHGIAADLLESIFQKLGIQGLIDLFIPNSHADNLNDQIDTYKKSIKAGHKVLVVAHSQGNFFTEEAYQGLDGWMQPYFEAISVASPMSADIKSVNTPRIDWNNDLVSRIATNGLSSTNHTDSSVRKIDWVLDYKPLPSGFVPPPGSKPDGDYCDASELGPVVVRDCGTSTYPNMTCRYTATEGGVNSGVHAFTFYMGKDLKDGDIPILDPFTGVKLRDTTAKTKIMNAVGTKLTHLKSIASQWQKAADLNQASCANPNTCKQRIRVEHFKDSSLTDQMKDEEIYEFNPGGKLYWVGGSYVKASVGGTDINDVYKTSGETVCFELDGTTETILPAGSAHWPEPKEGEVTVALRWETTNIDMDLALGGPSVSEQDIKDDPDCPLEHFNIQRSGVVPGTHSVYVTNKGQVNDDDMPEMVVVDIRTPDESGIFGLLIEDAADLNLSHVADIVISEANRTSFFASPTVRPVFMVKGKAEPYPSNDNGEDPYIYEIVSRLPQLKLGPVSGASVELYTLSGYGTDAPLYSGMTTEGDTVFSAGIIPVPHELFDRMPDDILFVFSAQGGKDIDADDDLRTDAVATPVNGAMHGILYGRAIKGSFKVNVLTEMAYQVVQPMLKDADETAVRAKLDEVAALLLKEDVNGDGEIDLKDMGYWMPSADKDKLRFSYAASIEPVVQKIYSGTEIYGDVMNLLYPNIPPVADAGEDMNVTYGDSVVTDGSGSYDPDGSIVEYRWYDSRQTYCTGSEPSCEISLLPAGENTITLTVRDDKNATRSDTLIVNVHLNETIDPELLKCVDSRLGLTPGTMPTEDQLLSVTSLSCSSYYAISDISWISHLPNMIQLSFSGNRISDISPLSALTSLEILGIDNNPVSDISVLSRLTQLKDLSLAALPVTDISPIGNLTQLKELILTDLPITDISAMANLRNLEYVTLESLQAGDLSPMDNLSKMIGLSLYKMPLIVEHPIENMPNLIYIDIRETSISDLLLIKNMTGMQYLYAPYNQLTSLDGIEGLSNLESIWVQGNQIENIDAVRTLTNVYEFYAWENNISDISPLAGMSALKYIILAQNSIEDMSPLNALSNAESVDLSSNNIKVIAQLSGMTSLKELDLYENQIIDISGLNGLYNLKILVLEANKISDLSDLTNLPSLTSLSLRQNEIDDVSALANLESLTNLYVDNNNLSNLKSIEVLDQVHWLRLSSNNISDISILGGLQQITALWIEDNNIQDISALQDMNGLRTLYLKNNCITDFSPVDFVPNVYGKNDQGICEP